MRASQQHKRPAAARAMIGLVIGALTAGAIAVAVTPSDAEPVVVAPVPAAAPVITPPAPAVVPAPARTAEASPTRSAAPSTTTKRSRTAAPRTKTRSSTSCADAAMQAGQFDPSCSQYQGYLDPGTAAGREPTSGEIQAQYACEQGLIPRSECG